MSIDARRRFFAEELEAVCRLRSRELVNAFAAVPRERFLPPGPWTVLAEAPTGMGPAATALTADADPARVCHNIAVAIDPARQLFNGQPGTIGIWIDALGLTPGARVLHVGSGLGYYTAVMAHCVGAKGRVVAYEVDPGLADGAAKNLASMPWVDVRAGDAHALEPGESFDAILINAGVTHPLDAWLDALAPSGRMVVPMTSTMVPMGDNIGKGLVFVITNAGGVLDARALTVVAIYSAHGVRDPSLNDALGKAMMAGPMAWQRVTRVRRDPHEATAACWYHTRTCCFTT